jgi:hypothetical protein
VVCDTSDARKPGLRMLASLSSVIAVAVITTSAYAADPRAVVELFTSQGCSSCPPADRVLGELTRDPDIIAVSLPIDYWDYLGWKDTLADSRFSARQHAYSHVRGDRNVYTPQAVINGSTHVVGSDRAGIDKAVIESKTMGVMSVPVTMTKSADQLKVSIPGSGVETDHAEVWLCAVAKTVSVKINRGENRGREVVYHNVVRNVLKIGDWNGKTASWTVPLETISRDGVDAAVVFLQHGNRDKPGSMLGAAYTSLN